MKAKKIPLMEKLISDGLFESEKAAGAALMEGTVYLGQERLRGGMKVPADAVITVRGREIPYAGKGGLKLEGALKDFGLSPAGRVCIDAGASTGGSTDCLLHFGAARVYAVDVGWGQLVGRLRQDARVVNCEKTNISDESLLSLSPGPDFGTVDVSYLSLRKAVPYFSRILHGRGDLVCLVKPLFEIDDAESRRTGVIAPDRYAPLLRQLVSDLNALPGTVCANVTHSPVTGNAGTREFFIHVRLVGDGKGTYPDLEEKILLADGRAAALEAYKKPG